MKLMDGNSESRSQFTSLVPRIFWLTLTICKRKTIEEWGGQGMNTTSCICTSVCYFYAGEYAYRANLHTQLHACVCYKLLTKRGSNKVNQNVGSIKRVRWAISSQVVEIDCQDLNHSCNFSQLLLLGICMCLMSHDRSLLLNQFKPYSPLLLSEMQHSVSNQTYPLHKQR